MVAFYWHGWAHWMFGFEYLPKRAGIAWAFRWILGLGPCDLRWRS
jgi:hypothetical protein